MNRLNDTWLRIIGISTLLAISISVNDYYQRPYSPRMLFKIMVTLGTITAIWHVMRYLLIYFRKRYPRKSQFIKRLSLTFLASSFINTVIIWLSWALQHLITYGSLTDFRIYHDMASITVNNHKLSLGLYGFDIVLAVVNFLFFQVMYEIVFFIHDSIIREKQLRLAEQEREMLRAANLQSQLDALKQQVNPHFLFNSLNALDSLIEDDPPRARVFLEELSTVYRYLLRSNEHHLIDLEKELGFIQSYYHLLKTRLGDGLQLNLVIDDRYRTYKLPTLTLQLLVENAFKHNIVLPDQPLVIDIRTDQAGNLLIQNNIQRKNVRVASNGVGLSNILTKYRVLSQPTPTIREANGQFEVTLPLIDASN
ncbi:sensor histidine kinase [Salmonirosea aquatica]|uniref:Sensor protein lytS n=1 Tax=Salmonirosea aquatica TaxID=2654236 RepID=A0A7C9BJP8_9BACT|nr:sensor protein lytS [Cytophagaceae bacterium SJW1-29]